MIMPIWKRYFLKQFIRMFFLFLICFYGLYVLIDFTSHTNALPHHQIQIRWIEAIEYYVYVFASRAEILLPVALLIAFVHTVSSLNVHQELVALMASGYQLRRLMQPFVLMGLLCVFLLYLNEEYMMPESMRKVRKIENQTKHHRAGRKSMLAVNHLILEDGSLLIYQHYDPAIEKFFDVYWIESIDSVYRIKTFSTAPENRGYYVDHLVREKNGELLQQAGYSSLTFPKIKFQTDSLQSYFEPDMLSISELAKMSAALPSDLNEKQSKILTAFFWKLAIPWLSLLAILAPAPFCTKFSRSPPLFMIYTCSLFGLIAFYMFMDAAQVVAKRQVIPPHWAVLAPFGMVFTYFFWQFRKLSSS